MLTRTLAPDAPPRDMAAVITAQSDRLSELTSALQAALYPTLPAPGAAPGAVSPGAQGSYGAGYRGWSGDVASEEDDDEEIWSRGEPMVCADVAGGTPAAAGALPGVLPSSAAAAAAAAASSSASSQLRRLPPAGGGATSSSSERCDVASVLRPLLGALDGVARAGGVTLLAALPPGDTPSAAAPSADVRRALSAALEAALHATPRGGALQVALSFEAQHGAPAAAVEVRCRPPADDAAAAGAAAAAAAALAGNAGLRLAAAMLAERGGSMEALRSGGGRSGSGSGNAAGDAACAGVRLRFPVYDARAAALLDDAGEE